ncbi:hypothetical protein D9M72_275530 [compost metagenome]
MAQQVSLRQEARQRLLDQRRGVPVHQVLDLARGRHQPGRHHQVAAAQVRHQRLREGAEVDHAAMPVQGLQRVQRLAAIAEFAVVVVFQDHRVAARRPVQQRLAPRQAHRHAQRRLVRGGDIDQRGIVRQCVHRQPFAIDRHWHHPCAQPLEQRTRHRVAGILHRHHGVGPEHQPGQQVDALLRAACDQDVSRHALHAARECDMAGNGLAQHHLTGRIGGAGRTLALGGQRRAHAARPGFMRKARGVGLPRLERIARAAGGVQERRRHCHPALRGGRQHRRRRHARGRAGQPLGHIGAVADARVQPAFGHQPFIRRGHRLARHAQLRAKQARRRHARAGLEPSALDRVADLVDDLRGQVAGLVQCEMQFHEGTRRSRNWSTDSAGNWRCTGPIDASIFHPNGRDTSARQIQPVKSEIDHGRTDELARRGP